MDLSIYHRRLFVKVNYNNGHTVKNVPGIKEQQWFHLAVVTRGRSWTSDLYIYKDGSASGENYGLGPGSIQDTGGNLRINQERDTAPDYVDELYFWNRALSDDEIQMLYNTYSRAG